MCVTIDITLNFDVNIGVSVDKNSVGSAFRIIRVAVLKMFVVEAVRAFQEYRV